MLFHVLKHPVAAHVVLVSTCNAEKSPVVSHYCAAEFGDVALEVNEVLRLLSSVYIVEVDVFVTPLEVVDDPLVGQLLLQNEDVLEEIQDALLDIKVVEFCYHGLLILQIFLVLVNQGVSLIYYTSDIVEDGGVSASRRFLEGGKLVLKSLVLPFLPHQLFIHVADLAIVLVKLSHYHLVVCAATSSD